jgi:hypothetical protein
MKTSSLIITLPAFILAAASSTNFSHAQTAASGAPATNISQPALPAPTPYTVVSRDANSAVWEQTTYELSPSGQVVPRQHRYTELASGLNYQANGQWVPSKEEIDILPDGTAAATNGQHQVYFPGDIAEGVITLNAPDGLTLESRPIALSYDDQATGNTVLIAILTNSVGYLMASNQVIYPNAFSGLRADLLYTYTRAGFEQNIVLEEQPSSPESFGLNPETTRLQVLTEFFNPPQPTVKPGILPTGTGLTLTDQRLNFGVMQMAPGKAFLLGTNSSTVRVAKQWLNVGGRQFLLEEVPVEAMADELMQLPAPQTVSTKISPDSPLHVVSVKRLLPPQHVVKATPQKGPRIQISQAAAPTRGLVLDYQTINGGYSNLTFRGDTTYYLSGPVSDYTGPVVFEGGSVLKSAYQCCLTLACAFTSEASAYRPIIFTSKDDNSVGEKIAGSTGNPYGEGTTALKIIGGAGAYTGTLANIRIANATVGLLLWDDSTSPGITITNAQFVNCPYAIEDNLWWQVVVENALFAGGTGGPIALLCNEAGVSVENSTFVSQMYLAFIQDSYVYGDSLSFTNCIFANVNYLTNGNSYPSFNGDYNGFYKCSQFGGPHNCTNTFYPFQAAGGGNYYLTNGCSFITNGTANIDPALLTYLATKTVYPPIVYSNTIISVATNFSPQVQRDTNAVPALGYHYDPVDYIANGLVVTNAQLTVANGAVIAGYGQNGIKLLKGGQIVSIGSPLFPNLFVSSALVQDQPYPSALTNEIVADASGTVNGTFRFTHFITPAGNGYELYHTAGSAYTNLLVQDCEFWGGANNLSGPTNTASVTLKNNLFWRSSLFASNTSAQASLFLTNNLFWGVSSVTLSQPSNGLWSAFNNDFDSCSITNSTLTNGYNAYLNCAGRLYLTNANDIVSSNSLAYQSSWFGNYYQPTNSPLIHAGSTSATNVSLYHYTVTTNQVVEGTNTVSIGYHYVAVDANGNPLDSNGDGIPDYLQDANGNGVYDFGDLGVWQNSLYLKVLITRPRNNSIIP